MSNWRGAHRINQGAESSERHNIQLQLQLFGTSTSYEKSFAKGISPTSKSCKWLVKHISKSVGHSANHPTCRRGGAAWHITSNLSTRDRPHCRREPRYLRAKAKLLDFFGGYLHSHAFCTGRFTILNRNCTWAYIGYISIS